MIWNYLSRTGFRYMFKLSYLSFSPRRFLIVTTWLTQHLHLILKLIRPLIKQSARSFVLEIRILSMLLRIIWLLPFVYTWWPIVVVCVKFNHTFVVFSYVLVNFNFKLGVFIVLTSFDSSHYVPEKDHWQRILQFRAFERRIWLLVRIY